MGLLRAVGRWVLHSGYRFVAAHVHLHQSSCFHDEINELSALFEVQNLV
jgi:hypothetical protein